MKFASQKLFVAAASSVLALFLTGCPKKPARPDPASTMMGPQGGSTATDLSRGPGMVDLNAANVDGLIPRGAFDERGQDRAALEAQTVYFDFDRSEVKASERPKLQAAKQYIDSNPGFRLLLEGHCDWRGTAEYNLGLGDRRANSVKKYLQSIGVAADRIETLSKGSLEAARNADDATMARDRRVNLIVVNPAMSGPGPAPGGLGSPAPIGGPRPL